MVEANPNYHEQALLNTAKLKNNVLKLAGKTTNEMDVFIKNIEVYLEAYHDLVKDNSAKFSGYSIKDRKVLRSFGYNNRGVFDVILSALLLHYVQELSLGRVYIILNGENMPTKVAKAPNRYDLQANGYNTF